MKMQIPVQCPQCAVQFSLEGELPPPVAHLIVQWFDQAHRVGVGTEAAKNLGIVGVILPGPPPVLHLSVPAPEGRRLEIKVPVNPRGGIIGPVEKPTQWGMRSLGGGVYALEPAIEISESLRAFVTLFDVPVPPPWGGK